MFGTRVLSEFNFRLSPLFPNFSVIFSIPNTSPLTSGADEVLEILSKDSAGPEPVQLMRPHRAPVAWGLTQLRLSLFTWKKIVDQSKAGSKHYQL
jgi:hypothetical protein